MAVVTSDYLQGTVTSFRAIYNRTFRAADGMMGWQQLAFRQDSPQSERNTYTWFGTTPIMEDVTHDQVTLGGLARYNFTIVNREYQAGLEITRAAMERDQLNLHRPRIADLGREAARHPGELIFNLFETPGDAFDGTAFFADTRVIGESANIDNSLAGTGLTVANLQTDLGLGRSAMRQFQDDRGRPQNLIPNTIVCPPALEQTFWQALNVNQGQQTNPAIPVGVDGVWSQAGYSVVVNPYLTEVDDWYLLHVGQGENRPFIWQVEKMPVLEGITSPNTEAGMIRRRFPFTAYGRYAVGVTDPRLAIKFTAS